MSAFTTIFEKKKAALSNDWIAYGEILSRVNSPQKDDDATMERLIHSLSLTPQQVESDLAAVKKMQSLQAIASGRESAHVAKGEADKALREHLAETAKLIAERNAEAERLALSAAKAGARIAEASAAHSEIELAIKAHAHLFPNELKSKLVENPGFVTAPILKSLQDKYPHIE